MQLLLLSLFAALVPTANSLTCECTAGSPKCGTDNTCTADKDCVLVSSVNKIEGSKGTPTAYRACQNSTASFDMCKEGTIFITMGDGFYLNSKTTCCNKPDKCNNGPPEVPQEDTRKSNRVCPSCFLTNAKSCNASLIYCAESQNKCLNVTGTYKIDTTTRDFVGKGCATSTAAILTSGIQLTLGNITYAISSSSMDDARDGASQARGSIVLAFLLPSLLGFLLDKSLN